MKNLTCLNKTCKLAFSATLYILLPVVLTAQIPDKKEVVPNEKVQHHGQVKDSTTSAANVAPLISDMEVTGLKESEKKDTSMNCKKDSFTPSQDEWLKNAGYFRSNKVQAAKRSRREPEPRQSAEVVNERND